MAINKKTIFMAICALILISGAVLALSGVVMRTKLSSPGSLTNVTYTAYFKGTDAIIQTEDSFNDAAGSGYNTTLGNCMVTVDKYAGSYISANDSYQIWAASIDGGGSASGNVGDGSVSVVDTTPGSPANKLTLTSDNFLAIPSGFLAVPGPGKVVLSWSSVSGATSYKIYRNPVTTNADKLLGSPRYIYERVASVTAAPWEDTAVSVGTTYNYIIVAAADTKRSGHSEEQSASPQNVTLSYITISPATTVTLYDGGSQTYTAAAHYSNGTVEDPVAAAFSRSPAVAGDSLNASTGLYTAPNSIAEDKTVTITATYSGQTAAATIQLKKKALIGLAIYPASVTVPVGASKQFTAEATYNGDRHEPATGAGLTWTTDLPGATITSSGSPATLTVSQNTSGAVTAHFGGQTATATVNVEPESLHHVVVAATAAVARAGAPITFEVSGYKIDNTIVDIASRDIVWSASAGTVAASGPRCTILMPPDVSGLSALTATATVNAYPVALSASSIINVVPDELSVLFITGTAEVIAGQQAEYTVLATDKNGNPLTGYAVSWTVAPAGQVENGLLTAPAQIPVGGQVTIKATAVDNPAVFATKDVKIGLGEVAKVEFVPKILTVTPTGTVEVVLKYFDANDNQIYLSSMVWTAPATVGSVDISDLVTEDITKSGITVINVVHGPLSSLVVAGSDEVVAGVDVTLTATLKDAWGNPIADLPLSWSSNLGTISNGLLSGLTEPGYVLVTAEATGQQANKTITVWPKYVELQLTIADGKAKLTGKDAAGNLTEVSGYQSLNYSVTGSEYGNKVNGDGTLVEGSKEGAFMVTTTVVFATKTLTANSTYNINKGAPSLIIKVGDKSLDNNLVISSRPTVTIKATDGNGVKAVRIYLDGLEVKGVTLKATEATNQSVQATYVPEAALGQGTHTLLVEAEDELGSVKQVSAFGLKVYSDLVVQGTPMNYPNPFKPSTQSTTLNYNLSKDGEIKITIYDFTGRLVYSQVCSAGSQGGKAGENEVTWDGRSFTGATLGNGVYVYFLSSSGKVLGSGEISIYQ